jgi:Ca2+-binding RTX toxin-like protein
MFGGSGTDKMYGEAGNDKLSGGGTTYNSYEYDEMTGGTGADTFVLGDSYGTHYLGGGYAIIKDFKYGEGDKIQLKGKESDYTFQDIHVGGSASLKDAAIYKGGDLVAVLHDAQGASFVPSLDVTWV